MPRCLICHMDITKNDVLVQCPGEHPVHDVCLKEWITHSKKCPLCNTEYSSEIIANYQSYIKEQEMAKENEIKRQQKQENIEKIEKITEEILFLKNIEVIENLAKEKDYNGALERLEALEDGKLSSFKTQNILFLRGKINILRERFDLAISSLFKLVKEHNFEFPDAFLYLGKAYEALGLDDKAKWAYDRIK